MADGLRRRNVSVSAVTNARENHGIANLKKFDVYAKVHDDHLQKSQTGGIVTMVTAFILIILFWVELVEFMTTEVEHSFSVDASFRQRLTISFNVTFPSLRCDLVEVLNLDNKGVRFSDMQIQTFSALDLDRNGNIMYASADACLPCAGAESEKRRCCNSCAHLMDAFVEADRPNSTAVANSQQCSGGCRLSGQIEVPKSKGEIRVSLVNSLASNATRWQTPADAAAMLNMSHFVSTMEFGEHLPDLASPLQGVEKTTSFSQKLPTSAYQYFLKLVPTKYTDESGAVFHSNQYSYTDSQKAIEIKNSMIEEEPAVSFEYGVSPFLMEKTAKVKRWSYIFTSTCALIGGVYSVAQLVELFASFVVGKVGCR